MGWKRAVRSLESAARKAGREQERRERAAGREINRVYSHREKLYKEMESDRRKVVAFTERVNKKPVRAWNLQYENNNWVSDPFQDNTGNITFNLSLDIESDNVTFSPNIVSSGKIDIEFLACSVSPAATYLALSVTTNAATAKVSLVNKTTPHNGQISIITNNGGIHYAIDDSINGNVIKGIRRTGVIAFQPIDQPTNEFTIIITPSGKSKKEPIRIAVTSESLAKSIEKLPSRNWLLEEFDGQIVQLENKIERQANESRMQIQKTTASGSGCLVQSLGFVFLFIIVLLITLIYT